MNKDIVFIDGINSMDFLNKWGDGSYKVSTFEGCKSITSKTKHNIYIPYLTPNSIWKTQVLIAFLQKGFPTHTIKNLKIGYSQYSRQERETTSEPALFDEFFKMLYRAVDCNIYFMDLHNPKVLERYDRVFNISHDEIFSKYVNKNFSNGFNAVAVDKGAYGRISNYDNKITFEKTRTSTGVKSKIISDEISGKIDAQLPFVLFDDIVDGGRTFIEASKNLKEIYGDNIKVILMVTHALLPFGTELIKKHIEYIVTTDTCRFESPEDEFIIVI